MRVYKAERRTMSSEVRSLRKPLIMLLSLLRALIAPASYVARKFRTRLSSARIRPRLRGANAIRTNSFKTFKIHRTFSYQVRVAIQNIMGCNFTSLAVTTHLI